MEVSKQWEVHANSKQHLGDHDHRHHLDDQARRHQTSQGRCSLQSSWCTEQPFLGSDRPWGEVGDDHDNG